MVCSFSLRCAGDIQRLFQIRGPEGLPAVRFCELEQGFTSMVVQRSWPSSTSGRLPVMNIRFVEQRASPRCSPTATPGVRRVAGQNIQLWARQHRLKSLSGSSTAIEEAVMVVATIFAGSWA